MAPKKRALGQGLQALFQTSVVNEAEDKTEKSAEITKPEKTSGSGKAVKQEKSITSAKRKASTSKKTAVTNKKSAVTSKKSVQESENQAVLQEQPINEVNPSTQSDNGTERVVMVKFSDVEPNRQQPRKHFDAEALEELADSIRRFGMIQPILVKKKEDYYEIIAGERRWRAAKIAGLREIPVLVREYEAQEEMEISLIENLQRKNLNPIEEAQAFQRLLTEFSLTQEEVADRMSISRSAITNSLRLLKLDEHVREMVEEGKISAGHARSLLIVEDGEKQYQLALDILTNGLSVRDIEKIVKNLKEGKQGKKGEGNKALIEEALRLSYEREVERLKEYLGSKVALRMQDSSKGRIEISYHSMEEFEQIMERISPKMGGSL